MLETASIAGGAVAALFLTLVVGSFIYVRWHQSKKRDLTEDDEFQQPQNGHSNGNHNMAADVVDAPSNGEASECYCQQSQVQFSQLSSNYSNTTNGDNSDLEHPQQQQFQAVPHVHHAHHHPPPKRPFGPHHYYPLSMSDVLLKR